MNYRYSGLRAYLRHMREYYSICRQWKMTNEKEQTG